MIDGVVWCIGSQDIQLHTLREVYTSTHWLVRIYQVLKPPAFMPANVFAAGGYKYVNVSSNSSAGKSSPTTTASKIKKKKAVAN